MVENDQNLIIVSMRNNLLIKKNIYILTHKPKCGD